VSAFVGLQALLRIRGAVERLRKGTSAVRFVIGIDLGGTSREVLEELLGWGVDVRIVKHRLPGHTFHPKLFLFEWTDRAVIVIGSSNITEGGLFGNYESAARISYSLPTESAAFGEACVQLRRFLEPPAATTRVLTRAFLDRLIARGDVPDEADARRAREGARKLLRKRPKTDAAGGSPFGVEEFPAPPPLTADLLGRLLRHVRDRKAAAGRGRTRRTGKAMGARPAVDSAGAVLSPPGAFYMTLPKLQGARIPGEARIPMEAIELAQEFWGWPEEYTRAVSPREGRERVYWNWRPRWRVWSVDDPSTVSCQPVRMYLYENSSDFRFYARPLVNAGADAGDIVQIRRVAAGDAEYECVLARQGTAQYAEWTDRCPQPVRNSPRRFGYA
jgi:hypothetical protein